MFDRAVLRRPIEVAALGIFSLACARFLMVSYAALDASPGDFYVSLPGEYAERLNPVLWDSPDLRDSLAYHAHLYRYGPTQFLTLFPIVFLDSYRQIALVLEPIYACLIVAALYLLWRTLAIGEPRRDRLAPWIIAACGLMFLPLLQAYVQREFEVVVFFAVVAATYFLAQERDLHAAAVFGYVTWFKFWPVVFLGYFVLRRRWQAVAVFLVVSAAVLVAAHLMFDLARFRNTTLTALPGRYTSTTVDAGSFCADWADGMSTLTSIRHGLCRVSANVPWLPAREMFFAIGAIAAALFVFAFLQLERSRQFDRAQRKWRTILEVSLVLIAGAFSIHGHYYYLIMLVLPIATLLYRYLSHPTGWPRWLLLGISYLLLGAFVVPVSVLSRLSGVDVWDIYIRAALYLWGGLALLGLLLYEYVALALNRRPAGSEVLLDPAGGSDR